MRVFYNGHCIDLPLKRFRLLEILLKNADHALSRSEIKARLWGPASRVSESTVDKEIERLRPYFSGLSDVCPIQTVRGVGYTFSTGVQRHKYEKVSRVDIAEVI